MTNKLSFEIQNTDEAISAAPSLDSRGLVGKFSTQLDELKSKLDVANTSALPQAGKKVQLEIDLAVATDPAEIMRLQGALDSVNVEIENYLVSQINALFAQTFVISQVDVDKLTATNRSSSVPVYVQIDNGGTMQYYKIATNIKIDATDKIISSELSMFFAGMHSEIQQRFADYTLEMDELDLSNKAELKALQNEVANNTDQELNLIQQQLSAVGHNVDQVERLKRDLTTMRSGLQVSIDSIPTQPNHPETAVTSAQQPELDRLLKQKNRTDQLIVDLYTNYVENVEQTVQGFLDKAQRFQFDPADPNKLIGTMDVNDLVELQAQAVALGASLTKAQGLMSEEPEIGARLTKQEQVRDKLLKVVATKIAMLQTMNQIRALQISKNDFDRYKAGATAFPNPTIKNIVDGLADYTALESKISSLEGQLSTMAESLANEQGELLIVLPETVVTRYDRQILEAQIRRRALQSVDKELYEKNRKYREQINATLGITSTKTSAGRREIQEEIGKQKAIITGVEMNKANAQGVRATSFDPLVLEGQQVVDPATPSTQPVEEVRPMERVQKSDYVNADGTLTDQGRRLLDEIAENEYVTEEELNTAFSKFMGPREMQTFQRNYTQNPDKVTPAVLKLMTPYERAYLMKYRRVMNNLSLNAARKVQITARAEEQKHMQEWGTVADRRRTGKTMKKLAKNEAAIAEQMQKSLMWQIEKERLESVNEWGVQYSLYLTSYDQPNAGVMNPPPYPRIEDTYAKIQAAGGPMAEAMVFLFETDGPDGAQDFGAKYMSLRKNNLQEMGKIYGPYADVLYGTPINQPGQVVDGNMEGVPGASYDEHEHQKIERRNASENYLMTKFRRKVRSQELGASKDLGRGSTPILQEIGKRHLASTDAFNFDDATDSMIQQLELRSSGMAKDAQGNLLPRLGPDERKLLAWLKIYSAEKRKEWIDACVKSLITMPVVGLIQEQYVTYRNKDHKTQEQFISLFFVNALVKEHNIPLTQAEIVKAKLTELRGGGFHNVHNESEGNERVGAFVKHYIENGNPEENPPTGLNLGKNWLNDTLGWKDYFMKPDGSFRGVPGTIKLAVGNLATAIGIPPKHVATISAYATAGVALRGVSLGRQFVFGYLLKPGTSFGEKLRKIGVTAGILGAGVPLLTGSSAGEWYDWAKNGGRGGKGILKFEDSKLGAMFGADNPEFVDETRTETKETVADILGEVKIGDLANYLTYVTGPVLGGQARFEMDDTQYERFMSDPSLSAFAKQSLDILVKSKSSMSDVSKVINLGLEASGITHSRYPELIQDPVLKEKTLSEFQVDRVKFEAFSNGPIKGLISNVEKIEELFYEYESWTETEKAEFEKRIEEMQGFETKRKEMMPYLRYNFVQYREDLYPDVGLDPANDKDILYNGLGDKNSYYDIVMFDYLKAKKSGNGDPLRTFDEFQDYYGEVLLQGDVESTDFLKEYLFVPDALTKLRELNISQPNGVYKMRANCDTEQWGVGNLALDGSFMRDEVLMHDIPGCEHRPDEEAFFHVNADDQLCIWVQDPTSKARNEFALESIGTKKDFAVDRMFKDASIQSGSNERFALSVTTSDGVAGDVEFNEEILGGMVDQLKRGKTKFKVEKAHMVTKFPDPQDGHRWDPISTAASGAVSTAGSVIDMIPFIGPPVTTTIRNIATGIQQDAQDVADEAAKIFPYTTIRFKPTGNMRPEW